MADNLDRYIFNSNHKEKYVKDFNDYVIKILYPNLKTAQECLAEEE